MRNSDLPSFRSIYIYIFVVYSESDGSNRRESVAGRLGAGAPRAEEGGRPGEARALCGKPLLAVGLVKRSQLVQWYALGAPVLDELSALEVAAGVCQMGNCP
eukprot:9343175-Heterocapsa_arctica.AAC.1